MDPLTIATAAVQMAKLADMLITMVEAEGGLTEEQKAEVKAAVTRANQLWESAGQ